MQNKSKLSKQKNLRATVSESLPGKSPDLRLQTDRTHADRTAHEDIPAVSGSETGRKQGIRGKATGPASSGSRCKPDEESRKTGCNGPLGTSAERKTRRNGQNGSERPGRSLHAEFAGTASARPSESAPSPISGQKHRATSGTVSEAKHRIAKKTVYLNIPS